MRKFLVILGKVLLRLFIIVAVLVPVLSAMLYQVHRALHR